MDIPIDSKLLRHIGILFIRDNMVIFKDKLHIDDNTAHFEAIQSSNWNSVRFKPPPSFNSKIGWRVEFRTMEI
jgi:glutamate--cysteine ligase catalytic subunit